MGHDIFQEVSNFEKPKIIEALNKSWPKHFLLQQYISLMSEYVNKTPLVTQALYLTGDVDNGLYLIQTKFLIKPDPFSLFFIYTNSSDLFIFRKALMETRVIPWDSKRFMFEVNIERFTSVVGNVFVAKGLRAIGQHYTLLWLPPESLVNNMEPPGDVFIEILTEKHAEDVAKNWPGFPGHENFIAGEISIGRGFGVFRKSNGKMLSSILSFHSGGVFMLYSLPEVRRKGYGEMLLRHIINSLRQQNITPFCTVFSDNIPSQKLVRKLGFVDFDKADYIFPYEFVQDA